MRDKNSAVKGFKISKSRYFRKLLAGFAVVTVAFAIFAAINIYLTNINAAKRNYQQKNEQNFEYIIRDIEYNMGIILNIGHHVLTDRDLNQYILIKDYETAQALFTLHDFIKSIYEKIYYMPAIRSLGVYFADTGRIVHNGGSETLESFFGSTEAQDDPLSHIIDILENGELYKVYTGKLVYRGSEELFYMINNTYRNYKRISIITFIKPSYLITDEKDGIINIVNEGNDIIWPFDGDIKIPHEYLTEMTGSTGREVITYRTDGVDHSLYHEYYNSASWHIAYSVSDEKLKEEISGYALWAGVFLVILLMAGIVIAFYLTGFMYKPISLLMSRVQPERTEAEQRTRIRPDEFEIISHNFLKTKQDNTQLRLQLEDNLPILRESMLKSMLYGSLSIDDIQEKLEVLKIRFIHKLYTVLLMEIDDLILIDYGYSKGTSDILKHSVMITVEEGLKKQFRAEIIDAGYERIAAIINHEDEDQIDQIRDAVRTIQDKLRTGFDISLTVCIGKSYPDMQNMVNSLKDAIRVMESRHLAAKGSVIGSDDINEYDDKNFYYPIDTERYIINAALSGNFDVVKAAVMEIIDDNFEKKNLNMEARYHLLSAMAGTMIRIFYRVNMTSEELFGKNYDLYSEFRDYKDLYQFTNRVLNIYKTVCDQIIQVQKNKEDTLKDRLIACIHDNYTRQDFSLNDMAAQFNLTPTYLSEIFKNRIGENFVEYLIKYRISAAKQMLLSSNLRVNEIAQKVGYYNTTSFIRVFKKYEGVSPGKFKEIYG